MGTFFFQKYEGRGRILLPKAPFLELPVEEGPTKFDYFPTVNFRGTVTEKIARKKMASNVVYSSELQTENRRYCTLPPFIVGEGVKIPIFDFYRHFHSLPPPRIFSGFSREIPRIHYSNSYCFKPSKIPNLL